MKNYLTVDPWKVIEDGFHPQHNRISESICSIGNGYMGQRANFEETYSGDTLQGSYISGIYYPDKTRVGWWKIGYPEYFAKVLNSVNWIGIRVWINGKELDLNTAPVRNFRRELDMQQGLLLRQFEVCSEKDGNFVVESTRFCSYSTKEAGAISYSICSLDSELEILVEPFLDFDVKNEDSNYNEKFWVPGGEGINEDIAWVRSTTKKTGFEVCASMHCSISGINPQQVQKSPGDKRSEYSSWQYRITLQAGQKACLEKLVAITTNFHHSGQEIKALSHKIINELATKGFETIRKQHVEAWQNKWADSDIRIVGDNSAQQGIRYNIFQLNQTYTGKDPRLNIGPKGFTGEKYGGSTYWDTEAYCLPFYLGTAPESVARNLLLYRYRHLPKAIENAQKLGFSDGAALYPMVTMNGEECHNEWEITFEEIHRNGAIAFAIFNYIRYTGDHEYLEDYGLEVLIGISRFWAQRASWSENRKKFVILGVTGPNEYENNVNNNWYTNYIARWCLKYSIEVIQQVNEINPKKFSELKSKIRFDNTGEIESWTNIIKDLDLPYDGHRKIFLQQDGFLDKVIDPVVHLNPEERPINQHWSWDRILRSCYIKQADVLQGIYFFQEEFDQETIRRNFDFYEPLTVHESSLSPCIHAILAARLDMRDKCYEMYLRTARLDLDDYNNDTDDGLHITSMAGTWLSFVEGIGGVRVTQGRLSIDPFLPHKWEEYDFQIRFRHAILRIHKTRKQLKLSNNGTDIAEFLHAGKKFKIRPGDSLTL